jgi:hypothetical protein
MQKFVQVKLHKSETWKNNMDIIDTYDRQMYSLNFWPDPN